MESQADEKELQHQANLSPKKSSMLSNGNEYFPSHLYLDVHLMIESLSLAPFIWIFRRPSCPVLLILLSCHVSSLNYKFSHQNLLKTFLNLLRKHSLENSCTWKCCEVEQSDVCQCQLLCGRNVSAWLHRRSRTVEVETFGANLGFCFFRNETMDGKVTVEGDRGTVMEWVCEFCIKLQVLSSSLSPWNPFPASLLTIPPPNPRSPLTLPVPSPYQSFS